MESPYPTHESQFLDATDPHIRVPIGIAAPGKAYVMPVRLRRIPCKRREAQCSKGMKQYKQSS
jgi:hypothetical protein